MDLLILAIILAVGILAGFVQRVSGFGLGIVVMLFLPHFMPTQQAVAVSTLLCLVTSLYNAFYYRKKINYKIALPMVIGCVIFMTGAIFLSTRISTQTFKFMLGIALIALSVMFIFFNNRIKIKPTMLNGIISGSLGGILGGLFSTGGPPAVIYLSSALKENIAYFATIQFYFCFGNVYGTVMRIFSSIIDWQVAVYGIVGIVGGMLGNFLGKFVFNKLNPENLKRIIYIGMIISGVVMFI